MKYTHTEQDREYYLMSLEEVTEGIINNNQDLINALKRGLVLNTVGMNVYFTKKEDRTSTYN